MKSFLVWTMYLISNFNWTWVGVGPDDRLLCRGSSIKIWEPLKASSSVTDQMSGECQDTLAPALFSFTLLVKRRYHRAGFVMWLGLCQDIWSVLLPSHFTPEPFIWAKNPWITVVCVGWGTQCINLMYYYCPTASTQVRALMFHVIVHQRVLCGLMSIAKKRYEYIIIHYDTP